VGIKGRYVSLKNPGAAIGLNAGGGYALLDGHGYAGQEARPGILIEIPGPLQGALLGQGGEGIDLALSDDLEEVLEIILLRFGS
jgi:hypothetical protein